MMLPAASSSNSGKAKSILVVDDEAAIAQLVKAMLESAGYQVSVALDEADAFGIAETLKPDLLIVDLMMPGIGGAELVRQLRASQPALPVLLASGLDTEEALAACPEASAVLQKPFTSRSLLEAVNARFGN